MTNAEFENEFSSTEAPSDLTILETTAVGDGNRGLVATDKKILEFLQSKGVGFSEEDARGYLASAKIAHESPSELTDAEQREIAEYRTRLDQAIGYLERA